MRQSEYSLRTRRLPDSQSEAVHLALLHDSAAGGARLTAHAAFIREQRPARWQAHALSGRDLFFSGIIIRYIKNITSFSWWFIYISLINHVD